MEELLVNHHKINPAKAAEILRNKEGKNDKKRGTKKKRKKQRKNERNKQQK